MEIKKHAFKQPMNQRRNFKRIEKYFELNKKKEYLIYQFVG